MGQKDGEKWTAAADSQPTFPEPDRLLAPANPAYGAPADEAPSRQQVQSAVERLRSDPNLPGSKNEKKLRFKDRSKKPDDDAAKGLGLDWLVQFVRWISETARLLMWAAGALAVALLAVGLRRWVRSRAATAKPGRAALPSHVQNLDIRPTSLPDDIGAAAAALWQRAAHRQALSLLYRGALSRLVHGHAVPIRGASTEGECVALAALRLDAQRSAFFVRLVGAWQLAVYGARLPESAQVLALCAEFELHLRPVAQAGATP